MDRKTKVALWVEALLVALLVFSGVLLSYFSSQAALNTVLKDSGSYAQISTIAKTAITETVSEEVKSSPIAYGVINWGINRFINEELIERLSLPTLNGLVRLSKTPTTIEGSNIVLDTSKYKTKLTESINGFDVPQSLKNAGNSFVAGLPAQVNVVDLDKRPNSVLAKVIRAKERLTQLKDIVLVLSLAVIAGAVLIGVWSRQSLTKDAKALSLTTIASGGATLLAAGVLTLVVKYVPLYSGETIMDAQINTLLVGISNYFLADVARWGFGILVIGVIVFIFTIDRVQAEIKHLYKKITDLIGSKKSTKKK